jgi:hypothetical protein
MEAFAAFFRTLGKKEFSKYYDLLPSVLNILPPIKDSQDSDHLRQALIALMELAETAPKMFKPLFSNLVQFSISVIQEKELDDVCRQSALELMTTFADFAPSMCRKDSSYTNDMITQCLSLMTDLGEDDDNAAEWLESDDVCGGTLSLQLYQLNIVLTNGIIARPGRERPEPCSGRANYGSSCHQAWWANHTCTHFQLASPHDEFDGLEG